MFEAKLYVAAAGPAGDGDFYSLCCRGTRKHTCRQHQAGQNALQGLAHHERSPDFKWL
jgi:hypothetical protein